MSSKIKHHPAPAAERSLIGDVDHQVHVTERENRNNQRGAVFWLTGLSGAGKSTLAMTLERQLFDAGKLVYVLDGDNLRRGLNADLGFSRESRDENLRRAGEVAALFVDAGFAVIAAFISPYAREREAIRQILPAGRFHEIYIKASITTCEQRDPKGLYRRARNGEIPNFTGVSAPYEIPEQPDLTIDTEATPVTDAVTRLRDYVESQISIAAKA